MQTTVAFGPVGGLLQCEWAVAQSGPIQCECGVEWYGTKARAPSPFGPAAHSHRATKAARVAHSHRRC